MRTSAIRFKLLAAAAGLLSAGVVGAQGFALEGAVIDSRNGSSLGVVTERGELNALFRAQKAMTFGILRSAGIPLDSLSPEVRARIERFATTNLEAFRAFSQGLDLKDQGRYTEAREFFRRAAELDPNFALAQEQRVSMPDVNVTGGVQLRAVLAAAAGAAVERGKAAYAVDLARAVAALQAGQNVLLVDSSQIVNQRDRQFQGDRLGGLSQGGDGNLAVASLSYDVAAGGGLMVSVPAVVGEIAGGDVLLNSGVLASMGSSSLGFLASRGNAAATANASTTAALGDGSVAYWGSWISSAGNSALISLPDGTRLQAPNLGRVDYVVASATRNMPTVGSATFTPAGGLLQNASGSIGVNFAQQTVALQNLGFQAGGFTFSNLNGSAAYGGTGAGSFQGFYTSGTCTGCLNFAATASPFFGSFAGAQANGLVFTTVLVTGAPSNTVGMHLFRRP